MGRFTLTLRDLASIGEALRLQISMLERQLAALGEYEENLDACADLSNDLGYLKALEYSVEAQYSRMLSESKEGGDGRCTV